MNKLLVRNRKGETRPMTKASFELAGKKRGFVIVGEVESTEQKSSVQIEMDRLRAEQLANDSELKAHTETVAQKGKPGPKPKTPKNED